MKIKNELDEIRLNIISENSRLEGKISLDQTSRVFGNLVGDVSAPAGSLLILCDTSVVEGNIQADSVFVDGYVKGDITAMTRILVSSTGRIIGNIKTPSLKMDFGAYFEGKAVVEGIAIPPTASET